MLKNRRECRFMRDGFGLRLNRRLSQGGPQRDVRFASGQFQRRFFFRLQFFQCPAEGAVNSRPVQHDPYLQFHSRLAEEIENRFQRFPGSPVNRITIDPRADRGESNGPALMIHCQLEARPVGGFQKFSFVLAASLPDRTDRMEYESSGKASGTGCNRAACGASLGIILLQFFQKRGTGSPMNGPVHTPSDGQGGIGGIHDRIDFLRGDVTLAKFQN